MNSVLFMILRRMRLPLIMLITSYAVSILGMTLIPGVDAEGRSTPGMDFFHAFYFVSYTATTIGFGEIPVAFSEAQRAWATFTIYLTVLVWLYSIGSILALLQDPALRRMLRTNRFILMVRSMRRPFYILCGYGETGSLLVQALDSRNQQAVVIDIDPMRISELELSQYHLDIPALSLDARLPESLELAGLHHPQCAGVIALTNDDQANLSAAVTTKLLTPKLSVLCRADSLEVAANMASFGTDEIINAFESFGEHMAMAIHAPGHYLLYEWLTDVPGMPLIEPLKPPRGKWVVCGFGRFGKAVVRNLKKEGLEATIIEAEPEKTACIDCVHGSGTDAATLLEAGIQDAVGIVAGTDNDVNNLSIVMTARELKADLFMVVRQNRHANTALFKQLGAQVTMQPSNIVAHEFLSLLTTPLLTRFFANSRQQSNDWANELISRIAAVVGDTVPEVWDVELSRANSIAVWQAVSRGAHVCIKDLFRDSSDRNTLLACVPLLLKRGKEETLLPAEDTPLYIGDHVLFCGAKQVRQQQLLALRNLSVLTYLLTGTDAPGGLFWQWLHDRRAARQQ